MEGRRSAGTRLRHATATRHSRQLGAGIRGGIAERQARGRRDAACCAEGSGRTANSDNTANSGRTGNSRYTSDSDVQVRSRRPKSEVKRTRCLNRSASVFVEVPLAVADALVVAEALGAAQNVQVALTIKASGLPPAALMRSYSARTAR